jgi:hypothetical protein
VDAFSQKFNGQKNNLPHGKRRMRNFINVVNPCIDKVKAEFIDTHYNWFVAVEPDSGEYFIDKDLETASRICRDKHPDK